MLVLSRKVGERLVIDGEIVVQVLEVDRNRIRIGIEAPPEVKILREELNAFQEPALAGYSPIRKPR